MGATVHLVVVQREVRQVLDNAVQARLPPLGLCPGVSIRLGRVRLGRSAALGSLAGEHVRDDAGVRRLATDGGVLRSVLLSFSPNLSGIRKR